MTMSASLHSWIKVVCRPQAFFTSLICRSKSECLENLEMTRGAHICILTYISRSTISSALESLRPRLCPYCPRGGIPKACGACTFLCFLIVLIAFSPTSFIPVLLPRFLCCLLSSSLMPPSTLPSSEWLGSISLRTPLLDERLCYLGVNTRVSPGREEKKAEENGRRRNASSPCRGWHI